MMGLVFHPALELAKVKLLGLSKREEALTCGINALRLICVSGLDPSAREGVVDAVLRGTL